MKSMKAMTAMKAMKTTKKPSIGPLKSAEATPIMRKAAKHIHWTKQVMKTMQAKTDASQAVNDELYGSLVLKSKSGHAHHCIGVIVNVSGSLYQVSFEDYVTEALHRDDFIVIVSPTD